MAKDQTGFAHLILIAVAGVLVAGGSVAVVAADSSKPGDVLYGVDRGVEKVRVATTFDRVSKARKQYEIADERLNELKELHAERAEPARIERAADEYGESISQAAQSLADAAKGGVVGEELADLVEKSTTVHMDVLTKVRDQVPQQATDAIDRAISRSEAGAAQSTRAIEGHIPDGIRNQVEDIERSQEQRGIDSLPSEAGERTP